MDYGELLFDWKDRVRLSRFPVRVRCRNNVVENKKLLLKKKLTKHTAACVKYEYAISFARSCRNGDFIGDGTQHRIHRRVHQSRQLRPDLPSVELNI